MAGMTDSRNGAASFRAARDFLLRERDDYDAARAGFRWPELDEFNWALDWFDVIAAEHPDRTALRIVTPPGPEAGEAGRNGGEERGTRISYADMAARSSQVASWLRGRGRPARRPAAAHAGQHRPALGDHSGRDEARRGDHPDLDAARPAGPGRPDQPWAGPARDHRIGARAEVPRGARGLDPDRGRAHDRGRDRTRSGRPGAGGRAALARGVAGLRGVLEREPAVHPGRPHPGRRPAAAVLHLRHDRPAQAGRAHARVSYPAGHCPRCTGSACSRATCT